VPAIGFRGPNSRERERGLGRVGKRGEPRDGGCEHRRRFGVRHIGVRRYARAAAQHLETRGEVIEAGYWKRYCPLRHAASPLEVAQRFDVGGHQEINGVLCRGGLNGVQDCHVDKAPVQSNA
jgi:hypothetical protein